MTAPRDRPRRTAAADRPRPDGSAAPGERLAALLAETGDDAPARPTTARHGAGAAPHDRPGPADPTSPGPADPTSPDPTVLASPDPGGPAASDPGGPAPSDPGGPGSGPAHRWEVAARTRVPVPLLLLAAAGLAVLAWSVLGPGGPAGPEDAGDPVLAEMGTDGGGGDDPRPVPVSAAPLPAATGSASAAPSPGQRPAVHVTGEVLRPGVVRVDPGARVVDAVEAAGGLTEHAATAAVNLAAPVADGQQVVVPDLRAAPAPGPPPGGAGAAAAAAPAAGAPGPAAGAPAGPVNLNTASVADLEALPKVGPVLAGRIVAFRDQQGGFAAVEDLDAVPGIGPALMEALLPLVTV